jgi:hypothetical protein
MTTELKFYDAAKAALAKAVEVDEVKNIHGKAAAMKAAARVANDKELEANAHEIRMRAERRLGEMMEKGKADRQPHGGQGGKVSQKPSLAQAGIDKNLAHRSRTAAKPSDQEFEQKVEADKEQITAPKPITVSEKPKPKKPKATPAPVPAAKRAVPAKAKQQPNPDAPVFAMFKRLAPYAQIECLLRLIDLMERKTQDDFRLALSRKPIMNPEAERT